MNKHKRFDHLVDAIGKFILLQTLSKVFLSLIFIILFTSSAIFYQKFAFDHIRITAPQEQASFDLEVNSEFQHIAMKNLTTPYAFKVPKGKKIEVVIRNNSGKITGLLKTGFSSVQLNHNENEFKLERDDHFLKGRTL